MKNQSALGYVFLITLSVVWLLLVDGYPSETKKGPGLSPSAIVTMDDGTVYAVSALMLFENTSRSSGFYRIFDDYSVEYVPFYYGSAAVLECPLSEVRQILILREQNKVDRARLTMADGRELEGYLKNPRRGVEHNVKGISGRTTVEGYPSTIELSLSDIDVITFVREKSGSFAAEVKRKDGAVTAGIKKVKFKVDGGDDLQQSEEVKIIKLSIGNSTLEIPMMDITSITRESKDGLNSYHVMLLRSGKTLKGEISKGYDILGKTTVLDKKNVDFEAPFSRIKSIVFK